MKIALSAKTRASVSGLLNECLADAADLLTHAKHAHWNVRGPGFLPLHELFDKAAAMAGDQADSLAERAGQLGSEVNGTLRDTAKATSLKPYPHGIAGGEAHVDALSSSLAAYGARLRAAIDAADAAGDAVTADLFTQLTAATDKMLWFVESHREPVAANARPSGKASKAAAASN